jgi:hypothetical protein
LGCERGGKHFGHDLCSSNHVRSVQAVHDEHRERPRGGRRLARGAHRLIIGGQLNFLNANRASFMNWQAVEAE